MPQMKDSETAGLSATEREALEDDSEEQALLKVAGEGADDDDDGDGDAGEDGQDGEGDDADTGKDGKDATGADDKGKADGKGDDKGDAATGKNDQATTVDAEDDDDDIVELPVARVTVPEDAEKQIKDLKASKSELFKKYNAGKIDEEAYQKQTEEAQDKIDGINRLLLKAETARENEQANTEARQKLWLRKVNEFIDETKSTEGIDYRAKKTLNAAFDTAVRELATEKDDAGNLKHGDKSMKWFLKEAHRQVKADFGIVAVPKGKDAGTGKPTTPARKAADLSKVPPSIARAPAAASSEDGGEFAHLDNLSGMALERAVAKLSPEQQARWAEA